MAGRSPAGSGHRRQALALGNQDSRGLQVESVLATPWIIGQALGHPMHHASSFGSQQLLITTRGISGPSVAATLIGLLAVHLAVRRASWPAAWPAATVSAVLVLMVTSRVLSPQFMVWALGLAAATIAIGRRSDQHRAYLLLVLAVLTQVVFPFAYGRFLGGSAPVAAVLAVRKLSLVGLTIWSLLDLFRLTRTTSPATAGP